MCAWWKPCSDRQPCRNAGAISSGIELVDVRDRLGVHARQRRVRARDADREPLVEQLVGHHEPVGDLARERRERRPEREPEQDREGEKWNPEAPATGGSVEARPLYNALKPPRTVPRPARPGNNRRRICPCRKPHASCSSRSSRFWPPPWRPFRPRRACPSDSSMTARSGSRPLARRTSPARLRLGRRSSTRPPTGRRSRRLGPSTPSDGDDPAYRIDDLDELVFTSRPARPARDDQRHRARRSGRTATRRRTACRRACPT